MSTFNEIQNLPESPADDDRVYYDPDNYGRFTLEWDSNTNRWVCVSTGGEYQPLPIIKDGRVNTDLFDISALNGPEVSAFSGSIKIHHGKTNTEQRWKGKCNFSLRGGEVMMKGDLNGESIPTGGFPNVKNFIGESLNTLHIEGRIQISSSGDGIGDYGITVDEFDGSGNFVTNHARQNRISGVDTHTVETAATNQPFADDTEFYGQTTTSGGSTSTAPDITTESPVISDLNFGIASNTAGDVDTTPVLDIHELSIRV